MNSKFLKVLVIMAVFLFAFGLTGCGATPNPTPEPPPPTPTSEPAEAAEPTAEEEETMEEEEAAEEEPAAEEQEVRLAVVLIGEITDLSWNAQMHKAAQEVSEEMGIDMAYSEQVADADVERVLREYADEGYNLIIAHSFSYGEAVFRVAPDYPDVNFAWAGGINRTEDNVADYDQPFYQAAYLIGMLAGSVSESGILHSLGGFDIPVCHSMAQAFKLGGQRVNPDVEMLSSYVGDWGDVAKAKEAALAQIEAGADFAIGCGEGPTLGAVEAAKEEGTLATGYVGNMTEIAPDAVALSLVWDLNSLLTQMVEDTASGQFQPGKYYSFGVAKDGFDIAINPAFEETFAPAMEEMRQVQEQIKAGEFEVPYVPEGEAEAPADTDTEAEEAEESLNTDIQVALLTFGSVADGGWNATAYEGLQMVEEKYGVETALTDDVKIPDIEAVMRDYCSQGFDLIIGHSFPFGDPAMNVAPDFPDCKFAITTTAVEAENVASYYPYEVESHFLAGVLAALMSESGKIGIVGGVDLPNLRAKAYAIEAGAKHINPDIEVLISYVGSFDDPAKGKELALAQIADGADVVDHLAATSGLGVIEAAAEEGVYVISDVVLNNDLAPDQMIGSHIQDYPGMVEYWTRQVMMGEFEGQVYRPGLESGLIDLAMTDVVPEDVAAQVQEVKQQIIDGEITVEEKFE